MAGTTILWPDHHPESALCFSRLNDQQSAPPRDESEHKPDPPPTGKPVRILRYLKIPNRVLSPGCYLINSEQEFRDLLGSKNERYIKWNHVDFSKQSMLILSKDYPTSLPPIKLSAIRGNGVIKLVVSEYWNRDSAYPTVVSELTIGVVVRKSHDAFDAVYFRCDSKLENKNASDLGHVVQDN